MNFVVRTLVNLSFLTETLNFVDVGNDHLNYSGNVSRTGRRLEIVPGGGFGDLR